MPGLDDWHCANCGGAERDITGACAACWAPRSQPQTRFLSLTCREALYGGAAGGGKTDSLLIDAIRYVGRGYGSGYWALLLRREFPELEKTLIPRSRELYERLGGKFNATDKLWKFPDGERVYFGHIQHEHDVMQYSGAAFCFIGFDELTTFTETQYKFLISRLRSSRGVPLRLRSATNPGGPGHEWVFKRFAPWLDPECKLHAAPGEVVHFTRDTEGKEHSVTAAEAKAMLVARLAEPDPFRREHMAHPLGRTFVPAKLEDNPYLYTDGEYGRGLAEMDQVSRARLRDGNWLIKPAAGLYFKRGWFDVVEAAPAEADRVRYWDRAGTEAKAGTDPDWTVGLKLARYRGVYFVEDVVRFRGSAREVEATIKQTAELDGEDVTIGIEQDPGQAGKFEAGYYVTALDGYNVRKFPVTKDKITRAQPTSAQAEAHNFKIVAGAWNKAFLEELESFPEASHDDQVDALSGAHGALLSGSTSGSSSSYSNPIDAEGNAISPEEEAMQRRIEELTT